MNVRVRETTVDDHIRGREKDEKKKKNESEELLPRARRRNAA